LEPFRKQINILAAVTLIAAALVVWMVWRYNAPVEVRLLAEAPGLPLAIEAVPPVVYARPGEMVRVVYRITNTDLLPVSAYGTISISPDAAARQLQLFEAQCSGLNTFQNSYPQDYDVVFRVEPAGLFNASSITIIHKFEEVGSHHH
jgi:cytochrome c oxidase assembly protein Cox11